ncbi:MAG: bifunctional hydroxymethylpyrimidine kinase/phosphomethylpyrimidine kinase [Bacteroidota bacterium]
MKVLCIHSLAIHGTASLKVMMRLLGTRLLPVASLYLSGLTNLKGIIKTQVDFEPLLQSSFDLARQRQEKLIVYIGYLGSAQQTHFIRQCLDKYQDLIEAVIVDPVSGDHGRAYVPAEVIEAWPELLERADWALPNFTELGIFSALDRFAERPVEALLDAFEKRFPNLNYLATSLPHPTDIKVCLHQAGQRAFFTHQLLNPHFGGTGDYFGANFVDALYLQKRSPQEAMQFAALQTLACIQRSIDAGSPDLLI